MTPLSSEQQNIAERPLGKLCVTACAGSGKTRTAVHRLAHMRELMGNSRGRIALLSYSNVAVETFQRDYRALVRDRRLGSQGSRIDIATLDSFFTTNVLGPHAHRTMSAARASYLISGGEPFLKGFTFDGNGFPMTVTELKVSLAGGTPSYYATYKGTRVPVSYAEGNNLAMRLGKTGAYTHDLGRFWVHRTLLDQPFVLKALAHRYPHIIIDEAQDIGSCHQAILELLNGAGTHISLIGDANQGIYEFADADGTYLKAYHGQAGVDAKELTRNFRSVPAIVKVANALTGRADEHDRASPKTLNGAYFTSLKKGGEEDLRKQFLGMLSEANISPNRATIVCRGNEGVKVWRGDLPSQGQGATAIFAEASLKRDQAGDYNAAFDLVVRGFLRLLSNPPKDLANRLRRPGTDALAAKIRRKLWGFTRAQDGLPSAALAAATDWHSRLVPRIKAVLSWLESEAEQTPVTTIGQTLAKTKLTNAALMPAAETPAEGADIRVETVHGVKGESIQAVMYVANKAQVEELIAGPKTEIGRIGYVAVTRAQDLFVLAVPDKDIGNLRADLVARGFVEKP